VNVGRLISRFRGHDEFHIDFIGRRRIFLWTSGALIAISLFGLFVPKLNFGIDFQGGALLEYENQAGLTTDDIRSQLADLGRGDAVVQLAEEGTVITVRTEPLGDDREEVVTGLAEQAGITPDQVNVNEVGPKWGEQISRKALQGLLIFLVVITIYISIRFELKMAVAGIVALLHDMILTAGVYALVGREVTPETVIAILTIMGYSLYDTVVIFDKVQENAESQALVMRETYSGAVNVSLNQVLMRSVNTSLTSLLPIGTLLLFGGETLKNFAFALFIGMAAGTYSSIFVAAPVLSWLKEREPKMQQIRQRAQRRERPELRAAQEEELEPAAAPQAQRPRRPAATGGARPAPRKPRKKQSRAKRKGKR